MENFPLFAEAPDEDEEVSVDKVEKKEKPKESKERPLRLVNLLEKSFDKEKVEETPEIEDKEPLFEVLENDEQKYAANEIVNDRVIQLGQELANANPETPEETEVLADVIFMENVLNRVEEAEEVDEELLDEAFNETVKELDLADLSGEAEEPADEENAHAAASAVTPSSSAPASNPSIPPGAVPPIVALPATPQSGGGTPPSKPAKPNVTAGAVAAGNTAGAEADIQTRPNAAGYFLLGGIVGYLIGRRRTKNRLTKEFEPIKEKLEDDVKKLQEGILERERKIRRLAHDRQAEQPDLNKKVIAKLEAAGKHQIKANLKSRPEAKKPDKTEAAIETAEEVKIAEALDKMNEKDLIEIAKLLPKETIDFGKMYEEGVLDQEKLKNAVKEFLKSGDTDRTLKQDEKPKPAAGPVAIGETRQTKELSEFYKINKLSSKILPLTKQYFNSPLSLIQHLSQRTKIVAAILITVSFIIVFLWLLGSI